MNNKVYIANAGDPAGVGPAKIQRIDATFDSSTPIDDVAFLPGIGSPGQRDKANPDANHDTIIIGSNSAPRPMHLNSTS